MRVKGTNWTACPTKLSDRARAEAHTAEDAQGGYGSRPLERNTYSLQLSATLGTACRMAGMLKVALVCAARLLQDVAPPHEGHELPRAGHTPPSRRLIPRPPCDVHQSAAQPAQRVGGHARTLCAAVALAPTSPWPPPALTSTHPKLALAGSCPDVAAAAVGAAMPTALFINDRFPGMAEPLASRPSTRAVRHVRTRARVFAARLPLLPGPGFIFSRAMAPE